MEPAARRAFLAAVRGAVGIVDIGALVEAVGSGQMSQVEAAAQLDVLSNDLRARLLPVIGQTFALGAAVGAEAADLQPAITYGFDLVNPESITWVRDHGASLVTEVGLSTKQAIQRLVETGIRDGVSPDRLAPRIMQVVGLRNDQVAAVDRYRSRLFADGVPQARADMLVAKYAEAQLRYRATMIARTETVDAASAGQDQLWSAAVGAGDLDPETTRRVWIATQDDRLDTTICLPLDGEEAGIGEAFPGGYMRPPAHPQCFIPSTRLVGTHRAVAGLKALYAGPVVTLETRRGDRLTVTPNHPVLTPHGWISAGRLHEGDDVLSERVRFRGALSRWAPQDQDGPAVIEQVVNAMGCSGFRDVDISREDLHGDARWTDRQVQIIGTDDVLRDCDHAASAKRDPESILVSSDVAQALRSHPSSRAQSVEWDHAPSRCGPRSATLALNEEAIALHHRPFEPFRFGASARRDASREQPGSDQGPGDMVFIGQGFLGGSGDIALNDAGRVDISAPCPAMPWYRSDDAPVMKSSPNHIGLGAELACDLLVGEASRIEPDRLVSVQWDSWHGHVYDLQTRDGFILAEGIVASNCRCATGLVFK